MPQKTYQHLKQALFLSFQHYNIFSCYNYWSTSEFFYCSWWDWQYIRNSICFHTFPSRDWKKNYFQGISDTFSSFSVLLSSTSWLHKDISSLKNTLCFHPSPLCVCMCLILGEYHGLSTCMHQSVFCYLYWTLFLDSEARANRKWKEEEWALEQKGMEEKVRKQFKTSEWNKGMY